MGFERARPDVEGGLPPVLDPSQRAVVDLADGQSAPCSAHRARARPARSSNWSPTGC
ncbi:MAG: hypothetical protein WDM88_10090 [Galbitalea sp.]